MAYQGNYQAAEQRVREMNRMAQENIYGSNRRIFPYMGTNMGRINPAPADMQPNSTPPTEEKPEKKPENKAPQGGKNSSVFPLLPPNMGIKIDGETALIILLIILLAKEGADLPLLAALGYLLI
ncbi:MAG: hypothetical protein LIO69_03780 [Oscillospiraceae bacterium]|nr:hypothetical protein [Oscillospiraceae bacterium]